MLAISDDSRDVWAFVEETSPWFGVSYCERVQVLDTTAEHFRLEVEGRAWLTPEEEDESARYFAELLPDRFGHLS